MLTSDDNRYIYLIDRIKGYGISQILSELKLNDYEILLPFFEEMKKSSDIFIRENQFLKYALSKTNLKLLKFIINNNLYTHYGKYQLTITCIENNDNLKFINIMEQAGFDFKKITLVKYLLRSKNNKSSYIEYIAGSFIADYKDKYQDNWKEYFFTDVFKLDSTPNFFDFNFENSEDRFKFELFNDANFYNILTFMKLGIVFEDKLIEHICKYNIEDSDYEVLEKEFNIHLNKIDYLYYSIQSDKPRKSTDIIMNNITFSRDKEEEIKIFSILKKALDNYNYSNILKIIEIYPFKDDKAYLKIAEELYLNILEKRNPSNYKQLPELTTILFGFISQERFNKSKLFIDNQDKLIDALKFIFQYKDSDSIIRPIEKKLLQSTFSNNLNTVNKKRL